MKVSRLDGHTDRPDDEDVAGEPTAGGKLEVVRASVPPARLPWPAHLVRLLGKVSDIELARRAKRSVDAVRRERRRRGIAPVRPWQPAIEWTREMLGQLGQASDSEVAAEFGISTSSVQLKRAVLGIPPFHFFATKEELVLDSCPAGSPRDGSRPPARPAMGDQPTGGRQAPQDPRCPAFRTGGSPRAVDGEDA